jgi:hypothetical protein
VFGRHVEVVLVDQRRTGTREENAHGHGNEHETGAAGWPAFAFLVDDGIGDEEPMIMLVEDFGIDWLRNIEMVPTYM